MSPTFEPPTLGDELREMIRDGSKRLAIRKVECKDVKHGKRTAPPGPSPKLGFTKDLESLMRELQAKAAEYHKLSEQARAAEWDKLNDGADVTRSDEVNFGLLETFARNVANRIKRILGQ